MRHTVLALAVLVFAAPPALAASTREAPVNKAAEIHGAPGNTPGFSGSSANPKGVGSNGGNGIHGCSCWCPGPGRPLNEPDDRPAGNIHGGLAGATGYSK